jgi:hypothetical protein
VSERTLSQRLAVARARAFVGRAAELDLFHQALTPAAGLDGDPPFSLLWFHGPGGVGKSTLVQRIADQARERGAHVVQVDARTCEPTPNGVRRATGQLGPDSHLDPGQRIVLLIDTAELLAGLDDWLREDFLPGLPERAVVVLAGRKPPGHRWRSDLGWAEQLRSVAVTDLDAAASSTFLAARGVPAEQVRTVIDLTHGHPLALALVADVLAQRRSAQPDADRQVTRPLTLADLSGMLPELIGRFVDEVPDPLHRKALQVFGHARVTTEGLLRAVLGEEGAAECFGWLRTLSFTQVWVSGRLSGLLPHDLARDVLDGDLRLRDPDGWAALRRAIRGYYLGRMAAADGQTAVSDLLWFHRDSPALAAYASWDAAFSLWASPARAADLPAILQLVTRHEGAASAELHEQWWSRQPSAFWVIRDRPGEVRGFVVQLALDAETGRRQADDVGDPFALAALDQVTRTAGLRAGQHLRIVRSWIGRDGYYQPTPTHQAITGLLTRTWLTEPKLAVTIAYSADEPLWTPMFAHVDYARVPSADVELGGRAFAAYLHDWRVTSMPQWLELLESRERGSGPGAVERAVEFAQRHIHPDRGSALGEAEFAAAVREAFRWATRPEVLARNPLSASRAVTGAGGDLRAVLEAQVARLQQDPRRERLARVLTVTFLTPAATQEAAAARLSLPFSTYRRYLTSGLAEVTRALWQEETG